MAIFKGETGKRGPWASTAGGHGPRIFKHGTNIVDKGLKVLFSAIFCYFSVFFPLPPLEETK